MKNNIFRVLIPLIIVTLFSACSSGGGDDNNPQNPGTTGTISGVVRDAQTQQPVANAEIVITDEDGNTIDTITTDVDGEYSITLDTGSLYSLLISVAGYMQSAYFNIEVMPNVVNVLQTVLQIDLTVATGTGSISGTILDATTGTPVAGATLRFREGINVLAGVPDAETSTDAVGFYVLTDALTAGNYTMEISLSDYTTTYVPVIILGGILVGEQNSAISVAPAAGETRIVLTWGQFPSDLDSHLTGPVSDNSATRFHVYYADPIQPLVVDPDVGLDVDDITSFGPETITISNQFMGTYRYSVHDFTNGTALGTPNSMGLATSGARVEVIRDGQPTMVFNVPNLAGTLWTVFEMNGDTITPVNTMSDQSSPNLVQSAGGAGKTDIELIQNLPMK